MTFTNIPGGVSIGGPATDPMPKNLVMYGDSNTLGAANSPLQGTVQDYLQLSGWTLLPNQGVSANTVSQIRNRTVADALPRFVTFWGGTNDASQNLPSAITNAAFLSAITDFKARGIVPLMMTPPQWLNFTEKNDLVEAMAASFVSIATTEGVDYFDVWTYLGTHPDIESLYVGFATGGAPDWIHLNDAGAQFVSGPIRSWMLSKQGFN